MTADREWCHQFPSSNLDARRSSRQTYRVFKDTNHCFQVSHLSTNLHEQIVAKSVNSGFVITRNRAVEEEISLFDYPILGNSALDRLANASFQIVIEGASYREKLSPHRKPMGETGGD